MKIKLKIILMVEAILLTLIINQIPLEAFQEKSFERKFVSVGPPETEGLERALDKRLPVYAYGIWPREEKFKDSKPSKELPKEYIDRLNEWVPKIINNELLPKNIDPNIWIGLKKLHQSDYIIGQIVNAKKDITLKIQADGCFFLITAESKKFFPDGISKITDEQIIKTITSIVNYPKEEVNDIVLEKNIEVLGDEKFKEEICYGKIRDSQYDPMRGLGLTQTEIEQSLRDLGMGKITRDELNKLQMKNIRTWWNYLPFWINKGRIFISAGMLDKTPVTYEPYIFKLE